ncbi:MAG: hypothetical protein V3R98_07760, partial [Alphaproteobacteria bacterium]
MKAGCTPVASASGVQTTSWPAVTWVTPGTTAPPPARASDPELTASIRKPVTAPSTSASSPAAVRSAKLTVRAVSSVPARSATAVSVGASLTSVTLMVKPVVLEEPSEEVAWMVTVWLSWLSKSRLAVGATVTTPLVG